MLNKRNPLAVKIWTNGPRTEWSWLWTTTIFFLTLSASFLIEIRISFYFLVFDWKKSVEFLILSSQKTCIYVTSLEYYNTNLSFKVTHNTWQPDKKNNNKKFNKDYIGLLGLLQTIRGISPLLPNKDKRLRSEGLLWIYER